MTSLISNCLSIPVIWTILVTSTLTQTELQRIRADPDNHWFLDPDGRIRLFHGVNSVKKEFPWYHEEYMLNDTRLDHLQEWGMNSVRLGNMWSGVEPNEGEYNETYIEIMKTIVGKLADRGIYSMLDMHQDVMSSKYGEAYDGMPLWLVDKYPPPANPYPWPLDEINNWEDGYFTQAASEGFQYFYDNANDSISHWAAFWGKVAEAFANNPNVLGYDLMNEPWIGDYISDGNLTLPGYATRLNLVDNYDIINAEIRRHDTEGLIFYEPMIYGQLSESLLLGSGFLEVPGGDAYRNVSAFSFHTYCWPLEFVDANATDDDILAEAEYCATEFLPRKFEAAYNTINRTGGGVFLTEFGLCTTDGVDIGMECDVFLNLADAYLMSWSEWDYNDGKFYDDDGEVILHKAYYHARPYARAVAGVPTYMHFNITLGIFDFEYFINPQLNAPTEIFVPNMHYACGYEVQVTANVFWEQSGQPDVIYVYANPGTSPGEQVVVRVTKGPECSE